MTRGVPGPLNLAGSFMNFPGAAGGWGAESAVSVEPAVIPRPRNTEDKFSHFAGVLVIPSLSFRCISPPTQPRPALPLSPVLSLPGLPWRRLVTRKVHYLGTDDE